MPVDPAPADPAPAEPQPGDAVADGPGGMAPPPPQFDLPTPAVPDVDVPSADTAPGSAPAFGGFDGGLPGDLGTAAPDETIVAPMPGAFDQPKPGFAAPAETGQLFAGRPDQAWPAEAPGGGPDMGVPPSGSDHPDPAAAAAWGHQRFEHAGAVGFDGPGGPGAPGGFDPSGLIEPDTGGGGSSSRTVIVVVIGVVALLAIGAALYFMLGGESDVPDTGLEGSFSAPHSRTTGVEVSYVANDADRLWIIEVLEPARDASAEGSALPDADEAFAATRIRVRNQATELSAPVGELRFNIVTSDGGVIDREANSCTVSADPLDFAAALPPGASTEGTVCWQVPSGSVGSGLLLGVESTEVGGRVHIELD